MLNAFLGEDLFDQHEVLELSTKRDFVRVDDVYVIFFSEE